MNPQFPFKDKYTVTQGYNDNFNNYSGGRHGALDIAPLDKNGQKFPANIYPVFNGSTISIQDTSVSMGKGIKEKVICDKDFVTYLKSKGLVPQSETGEIRLELLYWHVLEILDYDGTLTQDTPIAKCGNTGDVYSGGVQVPNSEKGVPPYKGLHLHIEGKLYGTRLLNTDKDKYGRIDLNTVFAYKGTNMAQIKTQAKGASRRIILEASNEAEWEVLCKVYGKNPATPEETVHD